MCALEPGVVGPCEALNPRYTYDDAAGKCVLFTWGGCGGNENNFETLEDCEKTCGSLDCLEDELSIRYVSRDPEQCKTIRFTCEQDPEGWVFFSDGCGCGCRSPCSLPKDVGPCDNVVPRWYYNGESGQCELFEYGGCEGNANNFETKKACEDICVL